MSEVIEECEIAKEDDSNGEDGFIFKPALEESAKSNPSISFVDLSDNTSKFMQEKDVQKAEERKRLSMRTQRRSRPQGEGGEDDDNTSPDNRNSIRKAAHASRRYIKPSQDSFSVNSPMKRPNLSSSDVGRKGLGPVANSNHADGDGDAEPWQVVGIQEGVGKCFLSNDGAALKSPDAHITPDKNSFSNNQDTFSMEKVVPRRRRSQQELMRQDRCDNDYQFIAVMTSSAHLAHRTGSFSTSNLT